MSSESGGGNTASSRSGEKSTTSTSRERSEDTKQPSTATDQRESTPSTTGSTAEQEGDHATEGGLDILETKPAARPSHQEGEEAIATSQVSPSQESTEERPRQVIAVSANKGPTAFFNLAKRFLITDEICDLSALEGAIVSAIDAAHLLERSKLATIVRVQTSYVTVEPKRKRVTPPAADVESGADQQPYSSRKPSSTFAYSQTYLPHQTQEGRPPSRQQREGKRGERELKRARIVITVRRTEAYKQWLDDNPIQAIIAGDGDDENRTTDTQAEPSDIESKSS